LIKSGGEQPCGTPIENLIFPDVMLMIQEDDVKGLAAFCGVVHPASVAEILEELEDQQVWRNPHQGGRPAAG
jgi:hypothetical protein